MSSIEFDNTWAKLVDATLGEKAEVQRLLTYKVPGAEFSAAYKAKRWNGLRTLLRADLTFPAGLALMPDFMAMSKVDRRIRPVPAIEYRPLRATLMDHQEQAVTRIMQATRGVVHHSVGAGKSIVIVESVRRTGVPSLVIVPTKDLLYQLHETFEELLVGPKGQNIKVGILGDGVRRPMDITIATVQTITRALTAGKARDGGIDLAGLDKRRDMIEILSHFLGVHIDECHHLPSDSYALLMTNLPNAYHRVGYSATPMRSGDRGQELLVTGMTGPVIHQFFPEDAQRKGRSVKTDVFMVEAGGAPVDDGEVVYFSRGKRRVKRDYATAVQSGIVSHEERNRKIAKLASAFGEKGPTIVLTERLEHGRLIAALLAERGLDEVH